MGRLMILVYGTLCYVFFLGTFLYTIGFMGNFAVPKSIDSGVPGAWGTSLAINLALLALFAVQHTVMARRGFKKWWTRMVPPAAERSTFVLATNLVLVLLFWKWQPIVTTVWDINNTVGRVIMLGLFGAGWVLVLLSTFMINHFDLFGLRQVYLQAMGKEYSAVPFKTTALYKYIRHPIMVGFIIAFWATPHMTVGHLLFAIMTTAYVFVGIAFEERDMEAIHGDRFRSYKKSVSMVIPMPKKSAGNG